jgi:hypothetical protein
MGQTKTLVAETARMRVYEIREPDGTLACVSEELILTPAEMNEATLRNRAEQALAVNTAYLTIRDPTATRVAEQVAQLTRECSTIIRLLLGLHDTTDGT